MLSQTVEYGLRVMTHLADQDQPVTIRQIADVTRVPVGYLAKVVRSLGRANLVRSQRGLHGGSVLARPAAEISLRDVVNAIEPIRRITACPLGLAAHGTRLCPMHRLMDDAAACAEHALGGTTLADLLATPTTSKPMCDEPRAVAAPSRTIAVDAFARPPALVGGVRPPGDPAYTAAPVPPSSAAPAAPHARPLRRSGQP